MTENTRILQMPIQSFWNLYNVVRGSPYSWYVGADCIQRRLWSDFPNIQTVEVYWGQCSWSSRRQEYMEDPKPEVLDRFREGFRNDSLEVVFYKTV
jgi:hypothetical protein